MISTNAAPPKSAKVTCLDCGLESRSPIVVANGGRVAEKIGEPTAAAGRCADRKACAMRQRRAANKQRAEKAKR